MEPLGFIAGAIVGAVVGVAGFSGRGRHAELASRVLTIERILDQQQGKLERAEESCFTAQRRADDWGKTISSQGLALNALEGRVTEHSDRIDYVSNELEVLNRAQDATLNNFEQQLQGMQDFIVQTAEEARNRRDALSGVPALPAVSPERGLELNELMRLQREAQQEFASRRRAAAAEGFQQPSGGGL